MCLFDIWFYGENLLINCVVLQATSRHHVKIDPESNESTVIYRVFFYSAAIDDIDQHVKDSEPLNTVSFSDFWLIDPF